MSKGLAELDQVVSSNRPIAGVCKGQRIPAIAHLLVAQVPPPAPTQRALSFAEVRIVAADGDVWVARGGGELIAALTRLASGRGEKTVAMVLDTISDHSQLEIEVKEPALSPVR
ncbi:hypothetical protein [Kribbella catacumbae]|uniref:hypothetical protein n=1 Tax=Kribbella catacumbae TaxID=460086 RepID=UPI000377CE6F|nr:hypothetical protein [Kribbella catacumbae]